jgi:TonB family protein
MHGPARVARGAPGRLLAVLVVAVMVVTACAPDEVAIDEPELIENDSPFRYPIELWDDGAEGETIVMVRVTTTGGVDSVYVAESSGHPAFDSAAVTGARELRFVPGRRDDRRAAMWTRVPVRFQTNENAVGGEETL